MANGTVAASQLEMLTLSGTGVITIVPPNTNTNRTLTLPDETGTVMLNAAQSVPRTALPIGSVLQVVSATKTDAQSTTSASYVDVTGMSVSITPTSASSKILVMIKTNNISIADANDVYLNIVRNSTILVSSTAGGASDTNNAWGTGGGGGMTNNDRKYSNPSLDYLDSPSTTSATTYKVQMLVSGSTGYFNRWALNTDQTTVSSITVMEIAA